MEKPQRVHEVEKTKNVTPEILLEIKQVSKKFDDVRAVDDVSLTINKGEIFALLGGSGSGKSTLLRMLAGFEKPTEGRIFLDGVDITDIEPYKRPINMMFQSYALFPHMTVEQNIDFGLKQDNIGKAERKEIVDEMLKLVHMQAYAKRKPGQLSGGQRQRVALARSLAKKPKLLLLDEPMGALDKQLRTQMQLEVVEILERVGVTCVMVTHDQEEAMTMSDRIAIMKNGRIIQTGSPTDIYESPKSRDIAEFIGTVNLFESQIVADEVDHVIVQAENISQPFYIGQGVTTRAKDKRVWLAIRPEKMVIRREKPTAKYNWVVGVVDDIAYLGGISIYYIKIESGQIVQCIFTNRQRRFEPPTWNDSLYISWEPTAGVVLTS
ncbi:polyamine ABC transporter ATP-binding protein [Psychromonas sp. MME2]|uniref:ABC transporter ATP-binding protein n=1 Tax=unclassified Psychromonas TaxID=2614957 RepID=UPI00339BDDD5